MFTVVNSTAVLGRAIRDARRALGLTQAELARRAGVTQATVSKVERDVAPPGLGTILSMLAVLRLELILQPRPEQGPPAPWEDA